MFLIHYAERKPQLALLSINSLHKDTRSSSQRIRANALRAMSSIRVKTVAPLVLLALTDAIKDSSCYVRKAAAHAIPKVYRYARISLSLSLSLTHSLSLSLSLSLSCAILFIVHSKNVFVCVYMYGFFDGLFNAMCILGFMMCLCVCVCVCVLMCVCVFVNVRDGY